jgi:hypothetical protein
MKDRCSRITVLLTTDGSGPVAFEVNNGIRSQGRITSVFSEAEQ